MQYRLLVVIPLVTNYNQSTWEKLTEIFDVKVVERRSASREEIQWANVVLVGDLGRRSSIYSILLAYMLHKHLVIWVDEWVGRSAIKDFAKSLLLRCAHGFVACGIAQQARIASLLGDSWTNKPCNIAPYFPHDVPSFEEVKHVRQGKILFLARLVDDKGLKTLYEAWKDIPENVSLTIAGDGVLRGWVSEKFSAFKNVNLRLRYIESEEKAILLSEHSILVSPSIFEPWGIIVNEAMYAGMPVIASTAVASAIEMVDQGKNGWLFPVGDHKALAKCIIEATQTDDDDFEFMRRMAWEKSHRRSLSLQVSQITDVLLKVV